METRVMEITPELAAMWLRKNVNNRNLSKERVKQYALAMATGHWTLTHQGIAFDTNDILIDGQHRLEAIVKAGIPIKMNVTFGVERGDGIVEIDTGRGRTFGNVMKMAGVNDRIYLTMSGVVSIFMRVKAQTKKSKIPPYIIKEYIDRHYEELAFIAAAYGFNGSSTKTLGKRHAPGVVAAAALGALLWGENRDAIEKFGKVWTSNDPSFGTGYSVKLVFDAKDKIRNLTINYETLNYIENTIRCFAHGMKFVRCYDCYPLDADQMR